MRSTARRTLAAGAATLALLLAACSSSSPEAGTSESASDETRVVTTDQGDVEIPTDPQKVVVLNYSLAGYLFDLDVPVIATIPESTSVEGVYSEYWADQAEEQGTEFLTWTDDGFDLEGILALEPDLIVAGGIGFPLFQATQAYDDLSAIAPTVIVSGDLTEWQDQFSYIADDVFGKGELYDGYLADYEDRVAEVKDAITPPEAPVTYVSLTADGTPYVLIEDRGLPQTLSEVGIEPAPIFAEGDYEPYTAGGDSFELSTEQVGQVLTQPSVFILGFNADTASVEGLSDNPVWSALPSFQSGQAYDLPYWSYRADYDHTMATLDVIEEMFS